LILNTQTMYKYYTMRYQEFSRPLHEDAAAMMQKLPAPAVDAIAKAEPAIDYLKGIMANPIVQRIKAHAPSAYTYIQNIASGKLSSVAIDGLRNSLGTDIQAGAETEAVNSILRNAETANSILSKVLPELGGAAGIAGLFALPYAAAAEFRKKIDADPNNPAYDNIPYAQSVRSGGKITQGQAGAANRRNALKNWSTAGNPAPTNP
jgi:hypothetical protein